MRSKHLVRRRWCRSKCANIQIVDTITTGNGLAASSDFKTVYVASSVRESVGDQISLSSSPQSSTFVQVRVYDRNPEDNSLTFSRGLYVPFAVDNLQMNDKDELAVAGHPKPVEFIQHEKDHRKYRSSAQVLVFRDPKSSKTLAPASPCRIRRLRSL